MNQFTESHLKGWKKDYKDLIQGKRLRLINEDIWMLGNTKGVICFLSDDEIAYICLSKSIFQTLSDISSIKKNNELIKLILKYDLGFSERRFSEKKLSKATTNKVKKIINNFEFSLIKINSNSAEKVLDAFVLVSDPIYNGHTTKLNKIIDDLPEKKTKN